MKLITLALVCLLVAGVWLQDANGLSLQSSLSKCCFSFLKKHISPKRIRCYRNSSSSCSYEDGVIFSMRGGQKNCALKTDTWVENILPKIKPC
ncbi:C-C motif chemokine 1 [Molossus nigricans]|uniref:C-C motif chemokine n=1 Tax=Molossus molossus TaxID=27622 RepID=A0A7J8CWF9_MOLMO|nr:C-C motif chemokine 1 [Molossus molossus]KAF6415227.1 C-C motif chemokine ligand 1 [Molossus molossus]